MFFGGPLRDRIGALTRGHYVQMEIHSAVNSREMLSVLYTNIGFKNSGLTLVLSPGRYREVRGDDRKVLS